MGMTDPAVECGQNGGQLMAISSRAPVDTISLSDSSDIGPFDSKSIIAPSFMPIGSNSDDTSNATEKHPVDDGQIASNAGTWKRIARPSAAIQEILQGLLPTWMRVRAVKAAPNVAAAEPADFIQIPRSAMRVRFAPGTMERANKVWLP
jgi:hypothetical protein